MTISRREFVTAAGAAALVAAVPPARSQQLEPINYLLPAPQSLPTFAPWVLAQHRGYYAREGLQVTFQTGRGGVDVAKQLGAGNAPIGGGLGDTPIIARAQGVPVKAVGIMGGRALHHLYLMEGVGINDLRDLKGKTMTVMSYQDTSFYVLLGILATVGLTRNDVDIQAAGPVGVWQQAVAGKSVGFAGPIDFGLAARAAGGKLRYMASDQYVKSMAQAILASDEMIQKRPELVRKLVRATLQGLADILKDPMGSVTAYIAAAPAYAGREAYLQEAFRQYIEYTYSGSKVLGAMDPERLAEVQNYYVQQGIVPKAVPVNELYTNQFIQ
ncbi:MAG: ABC transporter substrate-binding protein [Betaproteobacteria bacterium]|nr:ABC transporter substrate-binding protein [Betaproteobacteria bacterium]